MSNLFHSLTMAARSLQGQQYAMDVTGHNIANVNTPGYSRRVVDFAEVPPPAGGGVEVDGVRAVRDTLLERRLFQQVPLGSREAAIADALAVVEATLGRPGESLDAQLDGFFDAFADLAENPASAVARRQVQVSGESLAAAFGQVAGHLEASRRDADGRLRGAVDELNALTARIAEINGALPSARMSGGGLTLQDEQQQLVRRVSELAPVQVITRADGGVDLALENGRPLVVGASQYTIDVSASAPEGYASLSSEGFPLDGQITGGTIGGLLYVRDTAIPGYQASLDTLAFETAAQVNALHAAGFDLAGAAGGDFFSFSAPPAGVAGAARAIRVDPGIVADNGTIAAAAVAEAGDNGTARAIAALRHQRVLDGGTATLHEGWADLVYRAGRDARAAGDARDTQQAIVREVDALRDQVSGVSLDEEALNLLKFQRAYEANARFFTAVDQMLETLFNMAR
jgi:flagellar hook-associated protein 1 FlgK